MVVTSNTELIDRATRAYLRASGPYAELPGNTSDVEEHDDKLYVILRNVKGTLAVYRVRPDDSLRKLRRWPSNIQE